MSFKVVYNWRRILAERKGKTVRSIEVVGVPADWAYAGQVADRPDYFAGTSISSSTLRCGTDMSPR